MDVRALMLIDHAERPQSKPTKSHYLFAKSCTMDVCLYHPKNGRKRLDGNGSGSCWYSLRQTFLLYDQILSQKRMEISSGPCSNLRTSQPKSQVIKTFLDLKREHFLPYSPWTVHSCVCAGQSSGCCG